MGKARDLSGCRFGRLLVIELSQSRKKPCGVNVRRWKCICDCGKEIITDASNLLSGDTRSCGCLKIQELSERSIKNLSGKKFGRLTAICIDHKKNNVTYWKCKCECGNNVVVRSADLSNGNTSSCGCIQRVGDLSGCKFHMLTVLRQVQPVVDNRGINQRMWMCRCDCGKQKIISQKHIRQTRSCGCLISTGENEIQNYLISHGIKYQRQKKFSNCKSINELRFDFYIEKYNCCIEFDGRQHYEPYKEFYTQQFVDAVKKRDAIKNDYCIQHSIFLLRIKYINMHKVKDILDDWFYKLNNDNCPAYYNAG